MSRPTHIKPDGSLCFPEGEPDAVALPEGYWEDRDLSEAKRLAWARVKAIRSALRADGFTLAGLGTFQTEGEALDNLIGLGVASIFAALGGQSFTVQWTMADNSTAPISSGQAGPMFLAMMQRADAIQQRSRVLRAAIDAATDMAALQAIDIDAGWPT